MLTGDSTAALAANGIGDVHAELRPGDKARITVAGILGASPAMIGGGISGARLKGDRELGGATGSAISHRRRAFGHDLGLIPQALRRARSGGSSTFVVAASHHCAAAAGVHRRAQGTAADQPGARVARAVIAKRTARVPASNRYPSGAPPTPKACVGGVDDATAVP